MSALMNIPVSGEEVGRDPDPTNKMAVLTRSVQEHSCIRYVAEADVARRHSFVLYSGLWIAETMTFCWTVI